MSLLPQIAPPRWREWSPNPRWKEWIPLITQQQRLRSVVQVLAYNVPWHPGSSMYFTLHQTAMSPPFFTSERVQHQHPKWGEVDMTNLSPSVNTSATGVVLRLWLNKGQQGQDDVVLVWGVHFNGLVYLGPRLVAKTSHFNSNSVVLHMQGGYFTDRLSVKELPHNAMIRNLSIMLPIAETRPSYSISLLLRLRNIQQAIKKLTIRSGTLRDKILVGGMSSEEASISRESNPTIRKLLSKGRPKPQQRQETVAVSRQVEMLRFRVALLHQEKQRKLAQLEGLEKQQDTMANDNADHSCELTERYQNLHKEVEHLRETMRHFAEVREIFLHKSAQLSFRRKQVMSQLDLIYPVTLTDGKYTIRGIHLPNSEELSNADDVSVSVALGFVAHLVQMASIFLQVPLRYPIIHFGSRSKIIDHISEKIPDREREFPLFSRGKDKLQFHYGVYLLNKNIAQLRWHVGFPTNDLRATLHNVYHLLHLNQFSMLENHHRSMSGSSLDVIASSVNVSPVGSFVGLGSTIVSPIQSRARYRSSKSTGSTELLFTGGKKSGSFISPPLSQLDGTDGLAASSNLSCSLDKGLDEYEEIKSMKRTEDAVGIRKNLRMNTTLPSSSNHTFVGSEPNLVILSQVNPLNGDKNLVMDSHPSSHALLNTEAWERQRLPIPASSDEEEGCSSSLVHDLNNKSEFTLVTESLAKLVDSSKSFDVGKSDSEEHDKSVRVPSLSGEALPQWTLNLDPVLNNSSAIKKDVVGCPPMRNEVANETPRDDLSKLVCSKPNDSKHDIMSSVEVRDDDEVDIGTDALAAIAYIKQSSQCELENGCSSDLQSKPGNTSSGNQRNCDTNQESDQNPTECIGVEESVLVDNLFASVTSRTEALASHTTSFNLMSSRHGST